MTCKSGSCQQSAICVPHKRPMLLLDDIVKQNFYLAQTCMRWLRTAFVAGEIGNGHDGAELSTLTKAKQKGPLTSALLSGKLDRTSTKDANRINKAAWI